MKKILLLCSSFPNIPILRQTPGQQGIWNDCRFFINNTEEQYDYCVVINEISRIERVKCPPENTIIITQEPPIIKNYNTDFLKQFNTVISFRNDLHHENIIRSQPAVPWWVGLKRIPTQNHVFKKEYSLNYDILKSKRKFNKRKLISTITSDKSFTESHKKRISFVNILAKYFKNRLDVYGIGINTFEDKWDVIVDYKYHIALENCSYPNNWTEKLSDVFLAGAYPFYYGCPNLLDFFPKNSFTMININNPESCISLIEQEISNNKFEKSRNALDQARFLILDEYNMFPMLSKICRKNNSGARLREIIIKPENSFGKIKRYLNRIRNYVIR